MPVYRLEIEGVETLWITAHNERGALDLASAHIEGGTALEQSAIVQVVRDSDDAVVLKCAAGEWVASAREAYRRALPASEPQRSEETISDVTLRRVERRRLARRR
jgi:hypothetical protein